MAISKSKLYQKDDLQNLDNLAAIRTYFQQVKRMDKANLKGKDTSAIERILKLWNKEGKLTISGDKYFGEHTFSGIKELTKFYTRRARGINDRFDKMALHMVGAKSIAKKSLTTTSTRVVANGTRHLMTSDGEGLSVPFSHDFEFDGKGKITSLHIRVGKASDSEIAPLGALDVKDMGKLAAMAWMVA